MKIQHLILYYLIFVFPFFLLSCDGKKKEAAQNVVKNFHSAYKSNDYNSCRELYPNIAVMEGDFYKTDDIEIKGTVILPNDNILVFAENKWTNGFGRTFNRAMNFFLRQEEVNGGKKWLIYDSKNFVSFEESKLYNIALKTGAILSSVDTTDVTISRKIKAAKPMIENFADIIRSNIRNNVSIHTINWETGYYTDYAHGRSMCTNNSSFPIKNPKARLEFRRTKNGNIISTEETTICYGWLAPGESRSFTWYASNVGNVHWVRGELITTDLDEWVEEILTNMPFEGTEYSNYISTH